MKCLILAAGYATRLYPLTENFPKPLLKVGDKTILDWLVDDIDTAGLVDTYVVISNHKYAHHFENWAATKKQNIQVVDDGTSSNETRIGAVCDVQFAIDQLGLDDDLLVIAGDNVLDFSLSKFVAYAQQKKTSCIMRYYEPEEKKLIKCGVVELDDQDKILPWKKSLPSPRATGAALLLCVHSGRCQKGQRCNCTEEVWYRCSGQLYCMAVHGSGCACYGDAGQAV